MNDHSAPFAGTGAPPPAAAAAREVRAMFARAVARHQAGDRADAVRLYRQVLALRPDIPQALNNLGAVSLDLGRPDDAAEACRRAVVLDAAYPQARYNLGNALQALGRPGDALAAYRQAIALQPDYPLAHFNHGDALRALGRPDDAVAAYRRALASRQDFAEAYGNLGVALYDGGAFADAEAAYRRAIIIKPDYPEAIDNLGNVLARLGRTDAAVAAHHHAIVLRPGEPGPYTNLGDALTLRKDFASATVAYRRALALQPDHGAALNNLGNTLREQGLYDAALISYRRAITLQPDFAEAYSNFGLACFDTDDFTGAATACRRAIAFRPHYPEAQNNLGSALQAQGRFEEAITACRRAIILKPDDIDARLNLCGVFARQGRIDRILATYREAIAIQPDHALAHFGYGMILLKLGRYREGWAEYEWRWKVEKFAGRDTGLPAVRWAGEPLEGRTILLSGEQGLGDALQFARFAPLVAARGGRVVLRVRTPLVRLLCSVAGVANVVAVDAPVPVCDCHLPLMSVPWAIGTTLDTVPATVPYLRPDAGAVAAWRRRLDNRPGIKVGLVWAGESRPYDRPSHLIDRRRSLHLDRFAGLAGMPGLALVSLQKGPAADQARHRADGLVLLDFMDEIYDFADTAALVAALDLVIAVDTAVAHLAGALGKPVWILSRFDNCWRWLHERDDSPWYPTARLFRQYRPGDWDDVIARVRAELGRWLADMTAARAATGVVPGREGRLNPV